MKIPPQLFDELHAASVILQKMKEMESLHQRAIEVNPWFTPLYIRNAIDSILPWFSRNSVQSLLSSYPDTRIPEKFSLGIIGAGNIPLVCMHDLLMGWILGCRIQLKPSSKDHVLVSFLVKELQENDLSIGKRCLIVPEISGPDFLIATGSDNAAMHIRYKYESVPSLIRSNRYSLAVITGNETAHELKALCEDIFLYDGLGCRSVSQILTCNPSAQDKLIPHLEKYPEERFSPAYREMLSYEKAACLTGRVNVKILNNIILQKTGEPASAKPGYLNLLDFENEEELERKIQVIQDEIQCVTGIEYPLKPGNSQHPEITDFADGKDTIQIILDLTTESDK